MASIEELQTQLDLVNQLNAALRERNNIIGEFNRAGSQQSEISGQLAGMLNEIGDAGSRSKSGISDLAGSLNDLGGSKSGIGALSKGLGGVGKTGGKTFLKLGGQMAIFGTTAMNVMSKVASNIKIAMAQATGGLTIVINLIMSVSSALSGFMDFFGEAAVKMAREGLQVRQAWEAVADEFGRGSQNFNAIADSVSAMGSSAAGAATYFGYGAEGMAAKIRFAQEMAAGLGSQFELMRDQLVANVGEFIVAKKALGLSADAFANIGRAARMSGKDVGNILRTQMQQTVHLSKTFGVSSMTIGKNVSAMAEDMATFGSVTSKGFIAAAAYAGKLGVEIKALQGLTGKTDDFEGAAQAASELAQTFGVTVDTMDLMTADPAEKLDMLRKGFAETGKSFADMSRQEKQRLADISGMDVGDLSNALDPSNAGVALGDFEDAAAQAADGAVTQEEAMMKLTKTMSKFIDQLNDMSGKPFRNLFSGFAKGLFYSKGMQDLLGDVYDSLRDMYKIGLELGQVFGEAFGEGGGLQFLADYIRYYFEQFPKIMKNVTQAFRTFFEAIKDPKTAVNAFGNLFTDIFDGQLSEKNLGQFAAKTFKFLIKVFDLGFGMLVGAIPTVIGFAVDFLIDMLNGLTDWLNGNQQKGASDLANGMFPTISGAFSQLIPKLMEIPWGELVSALTTAIVTAFTKRPDLAIGMMVGIISFIFGGPIIAAAIGMVKMFVFNKLFNGIVKKLLGGGIKKGLVKGGPKIAKMIGGQLAKIIPKGLSAFAAKGASLIGKLIPPVLVATIITSVGDSIGGIREGMGKKFEEEFSTLGAQNAILAASVLDALTLGLLPDSWVEATGRLFGAMGDFATDALEAIGLGYIAEYLGQQSNSIQDALQGIADIIIGIFTLDIDQVSEGFSMLFEGIVTAITNLGAVLIRFFVETLPNAISSIGGAIGDGILWLATDGAKMLINGVKSLYKGIKKGIKYLAKMTTMAFFGLWDFITDPNEWMRIAEEAADGVESILEGMNEAWSTIPEDFMAKIDELWTAFKDYWGISSPSTLMREAADFIVEGFFGAFESLAADFKQVWTDAVSAAEEVWEGLKETISSSAVGKWITGIGEALSKLPDKIKAQADAAVKKIKTVFSVENMKKIGKQIVDGIVEAVKALPGELTTIAEEALGGLQIPFMGSPIDDPNAPAGKMGKAIVKGLTEQVMALPNAIKEAAALAMTTMTETIQSMIGGITQLFVDTMVGLVDTITGGMADVQIAFLGSFTEVFDAVMGVVQNAVTQILDTFMIAFQGAADIILNSGILEAVTAVGGSMIAVFQTAALGIVNVIDTIFTKMVGGINRIVSMMGQVVRTVGMITGFTGMGDILRGAMSFFGGGEDPAERISAFGNTFDAVLATEKSLSAVEEIIQSRTGEAGEATAERIANLVEAYNQTAESLLQIKPINIDAVLEQVNDSLRVRRDKVTINDGNVTINLSLNVTMKAEDIAIPLVEADLVTKGSSDKVSSLGRTT